MANEIFKDIKTRIALRWLDYATWSAESFKSEKPLKGEVWICEIPSGNAEATTAPAVLFKVGDGVNTFGALKWTSALAADVYAWAKKPNPDWADFPALPIEVIDNQSGKFITGFTYADNKLTITRSNVALDDIIDKEKIALSVDLGNVATLTTTAKTAVGAINEHDIEIGDLTQLNTTNKANLVSAINEALQAVEVGGTGSVVTVTKQTAPTSGSEATYVVNQGGKAVDVKIEIPKYATSADYGILEVKGDEASGVVVDKTDTQRPIVKIAANTYDAHGAAAAARSGAFDDVTNEVAGADFTWGSLSEFANKMQAIYSGVMVTEDADGNIEEYAWDKKANQSDVDKMYTNTQIDNLIAEAKKYADDNDTNTAHSHSAGAGLAITGDGGISGDVKYALNVAFELVDKTIKLYDKNDSTKAALATLDATEFIADGMLSSVTADQTNNKLIFEWNTDAGVTKTEIPLSSIADIYTGSTGNEVNVAVSNENVISDSLNNEVATKITHGETAYNWGNHASAGYAANADLTKVIDGTTPVAKATDADKLGGAVASDYLKKADAAAVKVNNATNADKAADADKLGGQLPSHYATAASVTDITKEGGTIDTKIANKADKKVPAAASNIAVLDSTGNLADGGQTIAQVKSDVKKDLIGTLDDDYDGGSNYTIHGVKNYVDKLVGFGYASAGEYDDVVGYIDYQILYGTEGTQEVGLIDSLASMSEQVVNNHLEIESVKTTANSAVQNVTTTPNQGLKATRTENTVTIDIDTDVVFVLDCNW